MRYVSAFVWVLAIAVMSAPVGLFYPRYVLPVLPLLAVLMAELLCRQQGSAPSTWIRWAVYLFLVVAVVILLSALALQVVINPIHWSVMAMAALLLVAVITLPMAVRKGFESGVASLAAVVLMVPLAFFFLARPLAFPDEGAQIVEKLHEYELFEKGTVSYLGRRKAAAKIRIAAGPKLDMIEDDLLTLQRVADLSVIIFTKNKRPAENLLTGFTVIPASSSWSSFPSQSIRSASSWNEVRKIFKQPDRQHFIAYRDHSPH